ncbi:glycosyltransferase family 2 protein [Sphingobacterium griseoflavum]|uniref:Glycosyl transferase n=1 Tax=Sphingobacterium griseoflavum TaxID=1474952 RepID=A0ABQ3HZ59_9SPHI|nr:glycosyltransferase family 2 protein [Sphingobacterium griseoflavum]GHE46443.1 glycosyl transferase [Sphingobacterium griseoflavum]
MTAAIPTISIITIVYNNVRELEYTLQSVISQTYKQVEYIVIDGASTDGTLDLIDRYRDHIDVLVSEKDEGIYDAMNKGLSKATGDYVLFMNAGDELYNTHTLESIFSLGIRADIFYGETKLIDESRQVIGDRRHQAPTTFNWKSFRYGMNICHQAIYIKRSLTTPYDTRYQLSADVDWVIKAAKRAKQIVNVHGYVARYLVGGMSQKRHRQSLLERYAILRKHYGVIPNLLNHGVIALRLLIHRLTYGKTRD